MSQDKQTVNVLVLELATMVVAISLAFTATIVTTLDFGTIVPYVLTNVVVIWFWWGYVVDRLAFPPKTLNFPVLDILILILISLIPFAMRLGETYYVTGVVGALVVLWAFLIRFIMREYGAEMPGATRSSLTTEVKQRLTIGPLFLADAALSYFAPQAGALFFDALVVFIIVCKGPRRRLGRRPGRVSGLTTPGEPEAHA